MVDFESSEIAGPVSTTVQGQGLWLQGFRFQAYELECDVPMVSNNSSVALSSLTMATFAALLEQKRSSYPMFPDFSHVRIMQRLRRRW